MQYSVSLKENRLFRKVYNKGCSCAGRCVVLYALPNGLACNRVGLTVSKKLGCAVVRNRTRRRLREIYRLQEESFLCGYDIIIVARSRAVTEDFASLSLAVLHCAKKLALLRTP